MNLLRLIAIVVAVVILVLLAHRLRHVLFDTGSPAQPPSVRPTEGAPPSATPSASPRVVLQRLAGVALGNMNYVVVEQPNGATGLYRFGEDVPGLGRIVEVTEDTATFEGSGGRIKLRITVPPSPTPVPASPTHGRPTEGVFTPSPEPDRTARESPPSALPDQSAS